MALNKSSTAAIALAVRITRRCGRWNGMRAADGKQEIYLEWRRTDFLLVAFLNTTQFNVCPLLATEAFETLLCICINSYTVLCFYSCVLLILRPPALIFRMIFPRYGLTTALQEGGWAGHVNFPAAIVKVKAITLAVLLHQIYTTLALPRAYPGLGESRSEPIIVALRQTACTTPAQCLPEEFGNVSVPTDLVNCTDGVCSCSSCFVVTGGACTIRQCWRLENGSCVDGRTRSQRTAVLLSAFLSSVGAANFYIGRNDLGAAQLVLFVFLVFAICAGIAIPCGCRFCMCACDDCIVKFCPCWCDEEDLEESSGLLTALCFVYCCGIVTVVIVLSVLSVAIWWIVDLGIFAANQRLDGNGCPLVS